MPGYPVERAEFREGEIGTGVQVMILASLNRNAKANMWGRTPHSSELMLPAEVS
jgi:hypothetical protein